MTEESSFTDSLEARLREESFSGLRTLGLILEEEGPVGLGNNRRLFEDVHRVATTDRGPGHQNQPEVTARQFGIYASAQISGTAGRSSGSNSRGRGYLPNLQPGSVFNSWPTGLEQRIGNQEGNSNVEKSACGSEAAERNSETARARPKRKRDGQSGETPGNNGATDRRSRPLGDDVAVRGSVEGLSRPENNAAIGFRAHPRFSDRLSEIRESLGFRTSAEVFEASQNQYEEARGREGNKRRRIGRSQDTEPRRVQMDRETPVVTARASDQAQRHAAEDSRDGQGSRPGLEDDKWAKWFKLVREANRELKQRERRMTRDNITSEATDHRRERMSTEATSIGQEISEILMPNSRDESADDRGTPEFDLVLRSLEEEFAEKERLSQGGVWCSPIAHETKVSTVEQFYTAFHDESTLPINTCAVCYRKFGKSELEGVDWRQWTRAAAGQRQAQFRCQRCFPTGEMVLACGGCLKDFEKGVLSRAASLHSRLGCEHMLPDELKGLTPIEEKLIALNTCYGFITKYAIPGGQRQSTRYPKHIKGHITVFPNNVQELVTKVLPHPLIKAMEDVHVSWQGLEKPQPSDLSVLLSVRRRVVENALRWLKRHNHLYANIEIDLVEMESWGAPAHGVPAQIYQRMERAEPSAREKARTGQVVPPTERGLEERRAVDVKEVLTMLHEGGEETPEAGEVVEAGQSETMPDVVDEAVRVDGIAAAIQEISSSGMFNLDGQPDVAETEKLRYIHDALSQGPSLGGRTWSAGGATAGVHHIAGSEPYILISRGGDFADSIDAHFFARTFPTLFPTGNGGPRLAEENSVDIAECGDADESADAASAVGSLLASRNMSLESWAKMVLQRHGGRFATHHVFAFLVFNILVRSKNRRVSMMSVKRQDFAELEGIVGRLSTERLERARVDLEMSGKTSDADVNKLLRSLSLYGFRQPMSREARLSMRRKIKSLIIRHGVPAIWFTLNPNDITNPVKLKLASHRFREPEEAEAFLRDLDASYKRVRLAISDPLSSALFFHREVSMFFEHYVKVGGEGVFGRISQYFGAVETNERGALHLHGLMWLHGNMALDSVFGGCGEEDTSYRERVIEYVDSVFTEVRYPYISL